MVNNYNSAIIIIRDIVEQSDITINIDDVLDVHSVQYSPNGKFIVSTADDEDSTVKIWNVETGECVQTLEGHRHPAMSAEYSPDGANIVSGSMDNTVKIWNAENGECLQTLEGHSGVVNSVKYSPDGANIVSASGDNTVRVWSVATGGCVQTLEGHSIGVYYAEYSPDGTNIVSAGADHTVKIWNVETGECVQTLGIPFPDPAGEGHANTVRSVKYSPDGKIIVSVSMDSTIKVWNATTGVCIKTITNDSDIDDFDFDLAIPFRLKQIHLLSLLRACGVSYDQCVEILSMM
jgi:WD40 repeat protein